jgi:glutathione S-transferase
MAAGDWERGSWNYGSYSDGIEVEQKMSLTLWGRGRTANVQKVTWCLAELGIDYNHVERAAEIQASDDLAYLATKKADFVPVLDHGGFILWEGNAIVRYLVDLYGVPPFWPADAKARADADRWMDYQLSSIRGHIHPLMRETPDRDQAVGHAVKLGEAMTVLERRLENGAYLAGDEFTAGDIPLGIVTYRWLLLDIDRPRLPNVEAWNERLRQRPAFQVTVSPPLETTTPLKS